MDAAGVALVIIGPGSVDQVCIMIEPFSPDLAIQAHTTKGSW